MRGGRGGAGRILATVFFTDMVGSTALAARLGDLRWRQLLSAYHAAVRRSVRVHGGREVDSAGDGLFAVFGSPASAIRCAGALTDELHRMGVEVRTGLHAGEVEELAGGKVGGIAVHLGARVSAEAGPGEILVTSTVRDLVAGSDVRCVDRGTRELKGIPGEWRLYAVERADAVPLDAAAALQGPAAPAGRRSRRPLAIGLTAAVVAIGSIGTALLLTHRGTAGAADVVPSVGSVGHLDGSANSFVAAPRVGHQPSDVASGAGSIWVTDYTDETLVQVDPTTGAVVSTRSVGGKPTGLCVGGGEVWVTTEFGLTGGVAGSVIRFDPATNGVAPPIVVGDGVQAIAYQDGNPGSLWVTNDLNDTVTRIDPASGGIVATIDLHHQPTSLAVSGGDVWVGGADMTLTHIDAQTAKVAGTIVLRAVPTAVAAGGGAVWIASAPANTVTHLDAASGAVVTTIAVDSGPQSVAVGDGAVWVATSGAQVVDRIDPAGDTVTARIRVSGAPHGVVAVGGGAWVAVGTR